MTEKVWLCHKELARYKTNKTMVMVVAAGVLKNNDRYRVQLDVKVNSRLFLFFVVILSITFYADASNGI